MHRRNGYEVVAQVRKGQFDEAQISLYSGRTGSLLPGGAEGWGYSGIVEFSGTFPTIAKAKAAAKRASKLLGPTNLRGDVRHFIIVFDKTGNYLMTIGRPLPALRTPPKRRTSRKYAARRATSRRA
jgi:hypothetical protein